MSEHGRYRKYNDRSHNSSTYHKKDGTSIRSALDREATEEITDAIIETRRPAMSSEETEIAIKVIDRWWSIKELGQEIKQLTQERDEAREDIKRLTEENDKLKAEVRRRHELTEERDEARAALRVRTKERDAALEAIHRMKEANESLKNKNN